MVFLEKQVLLWKKKRLSNEVWQVGLATTPVKAEMSLLVREASCWETWGMEPEHSQKFVAVASFAKTGDVGEVVVVDRPFRLGQVMEAWGIPSAGERRQGIAAPVVEVDY